MCAVTGTELTGNVESWDSGSTGVTERRSTHAVLNPGGSHTSRFARWPLTDEPAYRSAW